ncbi:MAG TPA: hypothetical protein VHW23_41585 [Kofleriaceae bacterium]|jgi:hypothetical protein|nr:hypothetical protein [Kofleriaceae bacterium]
MMRRFSWFAVLAGLAVLAGCPDDPYKAETWTKKLKDQREAERAVTELEQLGNPGAISPLGDAWGDQGKPLRWLQVIISLARPLTPEEAKANFFTDYEATGRPASWDRALPYLKRAVAEVDEANPRSVDGATKAADALGDAKLPEALDTLIEIAQRPVSKKLIAAQIAAIRAIGKYTSDSQHASTALIKLIDKDPPANPRTARDKDQARALEEKYTLFLGFTGAAINALGNLHAGAAARTLVLAMFRTPELFTQTRRALVASGPAAFEELRKVLAGTHPEVNQLFKDKRLDKYCGDRNDAPPDQCQPVSAMVFFPAVVLGDFYDARAVPELLAALQRPAQPVYYIDDQPSPNTQYNAIFDALRKIGSPEGAAAVRAMWMGHGAAAAPTRAARGSKRGAESAAGAGEPDLNTRILAISAYPFLTRDDAGVEELGKIAADNNADATLRQAAAAAFALLAHDSKDISILQALAQKYLDASAKKRAEADGKPKTVADAADKEFAKASQLVKDAKARAERVSHDNTKTAADIREATDAATKAADTLKTSRKTHDDAVRPFREADVAAKTYKGFARLFQSHIARIEVAIRCKDINCYAGALQLKPADAARFNASYIKDIKDWTPDEQLGLVEGAVERAMLELGKRGSKASSLTDKLLDSAKSDNRLIRQSVLLALPKIAAVPCANCEAKLQDAIRAGEGKTTLGDLNLETTMMKNYFAWAGGKTPTSAPAEKDDLPAPSAPAPPRRKK